MLSRVANSVYWMSRYIERAENVARFIDVNYNLTLGEDGALQAQWAPLVYTTGDHELFESRYGSATRENVVRFLGFDTENPNSIISCVQNARENARTIRDILPGSFWEQVNKFHMMVRSAAQTRNLDAEPHEFCDAVKLASHTLVGLTYTTFSHSEAWHFLRIGRLVERADKTSRIVDVQYYVLLPQPLDVGTTLDVVRWSALLKSAGALQMYRRVNGRIVPDRVAEFLILDRYFPRSIHFCLIKAQASLDDVTGSERGTFRLRSEQLMGRLRAELDYTSIDDIVRRGLHEFIDDLQTRLNEVGQAVHEDFFTVQRGTARPAPQRQTQTQTLT